MLNKKTEKTEKIKTPIKKASRSGSTDLVNQIKL